MEQQERIIREDQDGYIIKITRYVLDEDSITYTISEGYPEHEDDGSNLFEEVNLNQTEMRDLVENYHMIKGENEGEERDDEDEE